MKTNHIFLDWLSSFGKVRERDVLTKTVYNVLSKKNKGSQFRFCVKQLSRNCRVDLTRLSDDQIKLYLGKNIKANKIVSSTETTNGEVSKELNECRHDSSEPGVSQNHHLGKLHFEEEFSQNNNILQENALKIETLSTGVIADEKLRVLCKKASNDATISKENIDSHPSPNNDLEDNNDTTASKVINDSHPFPNNDLEDNNDTTALKENIDPSSKCIEDNYLQNYLSEEVSSSDNILLFINNNSSLDSLSVSIKSTNNILSNGFACKTNETISINEFTKEETCKFTSEIVKVNIETQYMDDMVKTNFNNGKISGHNSLALIPRDEITKLTSFVSEPPKYYRVNANKENNCFNEAGNNDTEESCKDKIKFTSENLKTCICSKYDIEENSGDLRSESHAHQEDLTLSDKNTHSYEINCLTLNSETIVIRHEYNNNQCLLSNKNCESLPVLKKPSPEIDSTFKMYKKIHNLERNSEEAMINFQHSQDKTNLSKGRDIGIITTEEKEGTNEIVDAFCNSKQSSNCENTGLMMSQEEDKCANTKGKDIFPFTDKKSNNILNILTNEGNSLLCKNKRHQDIANDTDVLDSMSEKPFSLDEKHLLENWWTKYKLNYKREKDALYSHYPDYTPDYDNECWSHTINEPSENPVYNDITLTLRELEEFEKERNTSPVLESSLESDISDSEIKVLSPEIHAHTIPSLNRFQSITKSKDIVSTLKLVCNPTKTRTPFEDDSFKEMLPPLPSYPPPRTPSPPPMMEYISPVSSPSSLLTLSPSISAKELSIDILDIPLPPTPQDLSRVQTQESAPHSIMSSEPKDLESSSSTFNQTLHPKNYESSSPAPASFATKKPAVPAYQETMSLLQKTVKQASPLSNSCEIQVNYPTVMNKETPLLEKSRLKQASFSHTCESSKSQSLSENVSEYLLTNRPTPENCSSEKLLPLVSLEPLLETPRRVKHPSFSRNLESSKLLSLSENVSGSKKVPDHLYLGNSLPPMAILDPLISPSPPASSKDKVFLDSKEHNINNSVFKKSFNTTGTDNNAESKDRINYVLSKSVVRSNNLQIAKCWKSKLKRTRNYLQKWRINKSYSYKFFKRNSRPVLRTKNLLSMTMMNSVLSKQKLYTFKTKDSKLRPCNYKENNSVSLVVGEINLPSQTVSNVSLDKHCPSPCNLSPGNPVKSYQNELSPVPVTAFKKEENSLNKTDSVNHDNNIHRSLSTTKKHNDELVSTVAPDNTSKPGLPPSFELKEVCEDQKTKLGQCFDDNEAPLNNVDSNNSNNIYRSVSTTKNHKDELVSTVAPDNTSKPDLPPSFELKEVCCEDQKTKFGQCFDDEAPLNNIDSDNSNNIYRRVSTTKTHKDEIVSTVAPDNASKPDLPLSFELEKVCEKPNLDNKSGQHVDESIPGDPITFKYVEDEENIEIVFEPITPEDERLISTESSTNYTLLESNHQMSNVNNVLRGKPEEKYNILTDLQVSSSDESEEDCYIRPRIINGFGDPFIILQSENNYLSDHTEDNLKSSNMIKTEVLPEFASGHPKPSSTLKNEFTVSNNKDTNYIAKTKQTYNPQEANQFPPTHDMPIVNKSESLSRNVQVLNNSKDKDYKTKNNKANFKERKLPLMPLNQFKTLKNNCEKINSKSSGSTHKIKGELVKKIKLTEIRNHSRDKRIVISDTTPILSNKRNVKSPSNKNKLKIESLIPGKSDINHADRIKDKVNKYEDQIQHKVSHSKPEKENTSYQPSSVRKRLKSEVENIILIQKKPNVTQIPNRHGKVPLQRTLSLPDEPSKQIENPVFDRIFHGMNASPPPKSLLIKEPKSKKYVARAYWCTESSTSAGFEKSNVIQTQGENSRPTISSQTVPTFSNHQSANIPSSAKVLNPQKALKRSISLNPCVVDKKLKNSNLQATPKENIILPAKSIDAAIIKTNKTSNVDNKSSSKNQITKKGGQVKTQEVFLSPLNIRDLNNVCQENPPKESLPSMPLIELNSDLESSASKPIDNSNTTSTSYRLSTSRNSSTDIQPCFTSSTVLNKLQIKVSIPISHFVSLNKNSEMSFANLEFSYKKEAENHSEVHHSIIPTKIECQTSNPPSNKVSKAQHKGIGKLDSKIIINSEAQGKISNQKILKLKRKMSSHDVSNTSLADGHSTTSEDPSLVVKNKKSQQQILQVKSIKLNADSNQSSVMFESGSKNKLNKSSLTSFHSLQNCNDEINQIKSTSHPMLSEMLHQKNVYGVEKETRHTTIGSTRNSMINSVTLLTNRRHVSDSSNSSQSELSLSEIISPTLPSHDVSLRKTKRKAHGNDVTAPMHEESNNLDVTNCGETTKNKIKETIKEEASTLMVKSPSLRQADDDQHLERSNITRRRISVLSPEALSNVVQSNDLENIKRTTWYMQPESVFNTTSFNLPADDSKLNKCNTRSVFDGLLKDTVKTKELINLFETSLKIGKKEYIQILDVIKCIQFDFNQKQDFIETVKKLKSTDVVEQEIKRATMEYERKLSGRKSFLQKTFSRFMDNIKNATDYLGLTIYVFLSQNILHICNDTALKDTLLVVFKSWIRNDTNKHVFDQGESAFHNDCDIIRKLISKVEQNPLLVGSSNTSTLEQSPRSESQEITIISKENESSTRMDRNINNYNRCTEFDVSCRENSPQILQPEPHQVSKNRHSFEMLHIDIPQSPYECPQLIGESSTSCSPITTNVPIPDSPVLHTNSGTSSNIYSITKELPTLMNTEVHMTPNPSTASLTTAEKHNNTDNSSGKPFMRSRQSSQQENLMVDDSVNKSSQQVIMGQLLSQETNDCLNKGIGHLQQIQGLVNKYNNTEVNIKSNQNSLSVISLAENNNLRTNHDSHQRNENIFDKNPCNALASQNNGGFDKYQRMRQRKQILRNKCHVNDISFTQNNSVTTTEPVGSRNMSVRNESSSRVLNAQDTRYENCDSPPQIPVRNPSVYSGFPQLQNANGKQISTHPSTGLIQYTHNIQENQGCITNSWYSENQPSNHIPEQTVQATNTVVVTNEATVNNFQFSPSQLQSAPWGENIVQQVDYQNHNLLQSGLTETCLNSQPAQHLLTHNHNFSQSNQTVHKPNKQQTHLVGNTQSQPNQTQLWQSKHQPCPQPTPVQPVGISEFANFKQNTMHYPKEQNVRYQNIDPQPQIGVSSYTHSVHASQQKSDMNHLSVKIPQNNRQRSTPPMTLNNNYSSDKDTLMPTIRQPYYSGSFQPSRTQCNQQQITNSNHNPTGIKTTHPASLRQTIPMNNGLGSNEHSNNSKFTGGYNQQSIDSNFSLNTNTSGQFQHGRKSTEMSEVTDQNPITEEDLDKLFSLIDSTKLMELMDCMKNNYEETDQQSIHRNILNINNSSTGLQKVTTHDKRKLTALQNIDNNLQIIEKMPDCNLSFNGINITKEQLLKFVKDCREQVCFAGLREDGETTFIGSYPVAEGIVFNQEQTSALMKGVIVMNAQSITKLRVRMGHDKQRSNPLLIKALTHTAFKDFSSYLRIINILKKLAQDNDEDALQAVQEIAGIMNLLKQGKRVENNQPIVIDD